MLRPIRASITVYGAPYMSSADVRASLLLYKDDAGNSIELLINTYDFDLYVSNPREEVCVVFYKDIFRCYNAPSLESAIKAIIMYLRCGGKVAWLDRETQRSKISILETLVKAAAGGEEAMKQAIKRIKRGYKVSQALRGRHRNR